MREFILSFLDTQPNHVDLKTVQKLIDYGKNNKYTAPMLLTQLNQMDDAHEKVLTVTFDVDFIDGVKLFNNHATKWLTDKGKAYIQELKRAQNKAETIDFPKDDTQTESTEFDGYLSQLMSVGKSMKSQSERLTLQEFALELRHLLTDTKKLDKGALNKFKPFVDRNWNELSTPMTPILVELSRRFLIENSYDD
ncbi:hypothetical protein KE627_03500 [Lentilactobacillus buchneri]|uniref:Uncharacterized protein n=2 Tax=Lentilactobacillus buchneri TaxID=1581 RepID=A0A4R5NUM9_LENBU|nr:hypothetical protein [Lentilactobacillus buchneri]AEB74118.1 hypothetical protein Lbuc_1871 [Lentilactobacillus buchneri NRRL B-30929]MCT2881461.1 hypothetical protein [Lentilactobacillus buchneri]MCT2898824.1 hypothetical protein [Lentilactobacillus buchneri]MCT3251751.1 hypothetical protein [Lentilactobacillus buchneri]MCT3546339.1 hypothetical protein [Lentilactobacillus buchneri]